MQFSMNEHVVINEPPVPEFAPLGTYEAGYVK